MVYITAINWGPLSHSRSQGTQTATDKGAVRMKGGGKDDVKGTF